MTMDSNQKGTAGELLAMTALIHVGYNVFRNASHSGKRDLIAVRDDEILHVQVKTFYDQWHSRNGCYYRIVDLRRGPHRELRYIVVDVDTGEVYLLPENETRTSIHKDTLEAFRIYP